MFIIIWEITPWPIAWSLYEPVTHLRVEKRWPGGPAAKDSPPFWHSPALALSLSLYQNHHWFHNLQSSPVLNRSDFCQLQSRDKPHPIMTRNHHRACRSPSKTKYSDQNWQIDLLDLHSDLLLPLLLNLHLDLLKRHCRNDPGIFVTMTIKKIVGMILQ